MGDRLDDGSSVPPKVLKQIIDNGSFATDELEIEYLAGVLVSSRTPEERDNRGASAAKTIDSLSNYQIRTHFILYSALRELFSGQGIMPDQVDRPKMKAFLDMNEFAAAMELTIAEVEKFWVLLSHVLFGLHKEGLIDNFQYGQKEHLQAAFAAAPSAGLTFIPSVGGIELYLWAFGQGDKDSSFFVSPDFQPFIEGLPPAVPKAIRVLAEQPESQGVSQG